MFFQRRERERERLGREEEDEEDGTHEKTWRKQKCRATGAADDCNNEGSGRNYLRLNIFPSACRAVSRNEKSCGNENGDGELLSGRIQPRAIVTLKSEWEWASPMMMLPYPTRQNKKRQNKKKQNNPPGELVCN